MAKDGISSLFQSLFSWIYSEDRELAARDKDVIEVSILVLMDLLGRQARMGRCMFRVVVSILVLMDLLGRHHVLVLFWAS